MRRFILSINGNKPFNYILKTVLSDKYNVQLAVNPVAGMRLIKEQPELSLLIIDMDMFESEAIDFILHIKSSAIYNKPIIVLTSSDLKLLSARFSRIKVDEIFSKPFNPVLLLQKIDKMLMNENFIIQMRP
jgi:response regulator RpfG family c-di-GMP phosphodiesterase